jgi:hypothetical protein
VLVGEVKIPLLPQPLNKRKSGIVSAFWTVRLVGLAHLAF